MTAFRALLVVLYVKWFHPAELTLRADVADHIARMAAEVGNRQWLVALASAERPEPMVEQSQRG
jgi:hypothetical protein